VPKPADFKKTFDTLRALLKPYERYFTVVADKPDTYYLATKTAKTVSGAAIWFGGVQIRKNYVITPSLRKRMQGKSCFNFTAIEPAHVKGLKALTKKGFDGRAPLV
jgi:hypothetical protein